MIWFELVMGTNSLKSIRLTVEINEWLPYYSVQP